MKPPLVSVDDMTRLLNLSPTRVVDTRWRLGDSSYGPDSFRTGHIPGAIHLDLDHDLSAPPGGAAGRHPLPTADAFGETMAAAGVDDETLVIAYDDGSGVPAARLWWLLRHFGHDGIVILDGGLPSWMAAGKPIESGVASAPPRRTFVPHPRTDDLIDTEELRHKLDARRVLLLDARGPDRWRGENEPVDPKAGHIPGAINAPAAANMKDGHMRGDDALREHYVALGVASAAEVVASCGSGVSACLDVLALEMAGFVGVRLYPASFSGWVAADLPVERA